jgi:hybrid cluster-associated redox disulfide protein
MESINKDMSIGEVLQKDMNTARIFIQYGMHCLGCPHSQMESIEQAGGVHGIDVDALVGELNTYFASVS